MAHLPTPIFPLKLPGLENVTMLIKRDDYSGVELSGNKVRKLEFILADAISTGADCLVTAGGEQSNHCRATACAARMLGLDCYLILRIEDTTVDNETAESEAGKLADGLVGNILLDRLSGAKIRFVTQHEYSTHGSDKLIEIFCQELARDGKLKPYAIPVGGSNGLGSWGYVEAAAEIKRQMDAMGKTVTDVAFACGSGGTAAGLAAGCRLCRLGGNDTLAKVHAFAVCDSAEYFYDYLDEYILPDMGLMPEDAKRMGLQASPILIHIHIM
jgi:1-aminocyclopropane-1-carboxylate deaminase/D-cysteine desulfhydrase-like pyridoxal-dependent ACC family enzyme